MYFWGFFIPVWFQFERNLISIFVDMFIFMSSLHVLIFCTSEIFYSYMVSVWLPLTLSFTRLQVMLTKTTRSMIWMLKLMLQQMMMTTTMSTGRKVEYFRAKHFLHQILWFLLIWWAVMNQWCELSSASVEDIVFLILVVVMPLCTS